MLRFVSFQRLIFSLLPTFLAGTTLVSAPMELAQSRLTSPVMNAVTGDTVEFTWAASESAEAFQLWVGTAWGSSDLYAGEETLALGVTLRGLPSARPLYARLRTKVRGEWYAHTVIFRVGTGGTAASQPAAPQATPPSLAKLISPGADGLLAPDRRLQWSAVAQAEGYYLWIGSSPGGKDVYQTGETKETSVSAPKLPANRRLYARLHTKLAGQWPFVDSEFMVIEPAVLTQPKDRGFLDGETIFRWQPIEGAEAYRLSVSRSPGGSELHRSAETIRTELSVESMPFNEPLHARLETKVSGTWHANDCRFINLKKTRLKTPGPDGQLDATRRFEWESIQNAEGYYLWIGSSPGGNDLYQTGEVKVTVVHAPALPITRPLYARIHTKVGGSWHYVDSVFTLANRQH